MTLVSHNKNYSSFLNALYWNMAAGVTTSDKWLFTSYLVPFLFVKIALKLYFFCYTIRFIFLCTYISGVRARGKGDVSRIRGATLKHLHDLCKRRRGEGSSLLLHFARQPYESIVLIFTAVRSPSGAGKVSNFSFQNIRIYVLKTGRTNEKNELQSNTWRACLQVCFLQISLIWHP
jgi:hypothetical protein